MRGHGLAAATLGSRGRERTALRTAGTEDERAGTHLGLAVVVLLRVVLADVTKGRAVRNVHATHARRNSRHAGNRVAILVEAG